MSWMEPDFRSMYFTFLNGGAPLDDGEEIRYWAEMICRVKEAEGGGQR